MRVYIWCDGAAMPNGGPAGAGYVVVGGVHLLGSRTGSGLAFAQTYAVEDCSHARPDPGSGDSVRREDQDVPAREVPVWLT